MSTKLHSFQSCLDSSKAGKRHLLVGNGFSRACRNDIFSYDSLFNSANFAKLSSNISSAFETLDTTDFEKVMQALDFCHRILSVYTEDQVELVEEIKKDALELKNVLVETIAANHPSHPSEILDEEYKACIHFLANFEKVYSTNYDMLLYWTTMKAVELKLQARDDGFRDPYFGKPEDYVEEEYVEWQNSDHKQNIHYLHGALHLFYSGGSLQKYCWNRTGKRLLEQINTALESRRYPLIVAEGESEQKLEKIQRSNYLGHNYRSLRNISGNLFVYGLSFSENDNHIIEQIRRNTRLKSVFVSLYGSSSSDINQEMIRNAEKMAQNRPPKKELSVYFYDAMSAKVWG